MMMSRLAACRLRWQRKYLRPHTVALTDELSRRTHAWMDGWSICRDLYPATGPCLDLNRAIPGQHGVFPGKGQRGKGALWMTG